MTRRLVSRGAVQISVSGWDTNNSAVMPNATLGYACSALYVIDTVLLPAASLADIPPFSALGAHCVTPGEYQTPSRARIGMHAAVRLLCLPLRLR